MDSKLPPSVPQVPGMAPMPQPKMAGAVLAGPTGLPKAMAAPADPNAEGPTVDELPGETVVTLSFWQHPFVQNIAPLLISLLVHMGILIMGYVALKAVKAVSGIIEKNQVTVSEGVVEQAPEGGVLHPGMGGDPTRDAAQDKFDVKDATGINDKPGKDLTATLSGGGSGDTSDGVLGVAVGGTGLGSGRGIGTGKGDGSGGGSGDGGALAPFGVPGGGGGIGPRSNFAGTSTRANKIVYVLDATGSMMSSFDDLRRQLKMAVGGLRPPQSFNIIFINDKNPPPLAPELLFASPENKRKAEEYVETMAPRGATEPLPALEKAYGMKPELINLLMDPTDIPNRKLMLDLITKHSTGGKIKLNIIAFEGTADPDVTKFLKELATSSGGQYVFKTAKDLAGN